MKKNRRRAGVQVKKKKLSQRKKNLLIELIYFGMDMATKAVNGNSYL